MNLEIVGFLMYIPVQNQMVETSLKTFDVSSEKDYTLHLSKVPI